MTKTGGRGATVRAIPGDLALSVTMTKMPAPRGWRWVKLSEVARMESGHTPSRNYPEYWSGNIPWMSVGDARSCHGGVIEDTREHTNELGIANSSARLLPVGTVCLSRGGSVGYVVRTGRLMATSQGFVNWICSKELDPKFLQYLFLAEQDSLDRFSIGATLKTIYYPELKAFHICMPPLEEQRRIVAVLDETFAAITTAIANAERNLANVRELFALQRERLLRNPPESWKERRLADLCTVKHGFAFKSEFFVERGDKILLTPGNFFEAGGYRDRGSKQKFYSGPVPDGFTLRSGDLLVAMTEQAAGLLGSPILVPDNGVFLHNQRLGLVEPKPGVEWANEFFYHVFNTAHVRDALHASGTGQKVRHTSPSKIGDIRVKYPTSRSEQLSVALRLDQLEKAMDDLSELQALRISSLAALKGSLLKKAFSGELMATVVGALSSPPEVNFATPQFTAQVVAFAHHRHERQQSQKTFGHVKAQKALHLVESIGGIDLGRNPIKDAAGPNDFHHMLRATDWAAQQGFFEFVPRASGKGYDFKKLANYASHWTDTLAATRPVAAALERAIDPIVPMVSLEAEVFATVHAAWNNLLRDAITISDDAIVKEARDDWHSAKLTIPKSKFRAAIKAIRAKGLAPDGTAKYVGGQGGLF